MFLSKNTTQIWRVIRYCFITKILDVWYLNVITDIPDSADRYMFEIAQVSNQLPKPKYIL